MAQMTDFAAQSNVEAPKVLLIVTARTFWDNAHWMREFMKLLNSRR